ncbi:S49 family peptidase [Myxococcota bacterium]|nr:S49 family peptidase [Myxococcota bacterium]
MRFLLWLIAPFRLLIALLLRPLKLRARRRALKEHGWVEAHLEGAVHEVRPISRLPKIVKRFLPQDEAPRIVLSRLHKFSVELASDPYAKGVLVRLGAIGGGWASAMRIRDELARLRDAGKEVVIHVASHAGNREILVATAGTKVYMTPSGGLASVGSAATSLYLKDTLAKLGVTFEVSKRGRYKAAPEQFTRTDRSEGDREQTKALVDALDDALLNGIMQGRGVDRATAERMIDDAPMVGAMAAKKGWVDGLARDEELPGVVQAIARSEKAPVLMGAGTYLQVRELGPLLPRRRKRVGIVEVHGAIADRGSPYAPYFGKLAVERAVVNDLRAALEDSSIGAVVLHVDSRGGSVTASDAIWSAVKRLDQEKPVIACFGDVSASGGYYVACGARAIVCSPLTVTGSIGVFAMYPTWPELTRMLGVHHDVISNRLNAALYDPWVGIDDRARAHADHEVGVMYENFLELVAAARRKTRDEVHAVAEGHIWTGRAARDVGLVDGTGGMVEAIDRARAAAKTKLAEDPVVVHSRRHHGRPDPYEPDEKEKQAALGGPIELLGELVGRGPGGAIARELLLLTLTSSRRAPAIAYAPIDVD